MESLHPVFQSAQIASLDLASLAGIRASCLARTSVAGRRGCAVSYGPPDGVRKNRQQPLVFRTSPDILLRMIGETSGTESESPPVRMMRYPFQYKRDQAKRNSVCEHQDAFQRYSRHGLTLLPNNLALNNDVSKEDVFWFFGGCARPHVANAQEAQVKNGHRSSDNENDVARHAQPLQYGVGMAADVVERAGDIVFIVGGAMPILYLC